MPNIVSLVDVRAAAKALREARAGGGRGVEAHYKRCLDTIWKYTIQCGCACVCKKTQGLEKTTYKKGGEECVHMLCEECRDGMATCAQCNTRTLDEMEECEGVEMCAGCYEDHTACCENCDERFLTEHMHGGRVCEDCYDEYYMTCSSCSAIMREEDAREVEGEEYDDETLYVCYECCTSDRLRSKKYRGVITSYGWVPAGGWKKYGESSDPRTLGVELEVHSKGDRATLVKDVFDKVGSFVIASTDGSLDSMYGVEFRSHPATLEEGSKRWTEVLEVLKGRAISHNCTEPHGLHVHVGLDGITELAQAKVAYFMHSPQSVPYLRALARREGCRYSKFDPAKGTGGVKTRGFKNAGDRYEVLNWGSKTVEFRLFRGTTKLTTFLSCVEFTHALVQYALQDRDINKVGVEDFVEWLRDQGRYPNLSRYDHTGEHDVA